MSVRRLLALGLLLIAATPAVQAQPAAEVQPGGVLAREPQTPEELFGAAVTMLRLARPELARQYLDAFAATNPDDATLLALRETHGTAAFVQMSRIEALQPLGGQLLQRLNEASRAQLADPAFQQSLIDALTGNLREREAAIETLKVFGADAVPLILQRLAAGSAPEVQQQLTLALLRMGASAVAPLEAALTAPIDSIQSVAASVLGRLEAEQTRLSLMALAFDESESAAVRDLARSSLSRIEFGTPEKANQITGFRLADQLKARAREALAGDVELEPNLDGELLVWAWNPDAGTVAAFPATRTTAAVHAAELWSRRALNVAPQDEEAQALLLASLMWRDVAAAGWTAPLPLGPGTSHDLALVAGPQLARETLNIGMKSGNTAVVLTSLSALMQTGSRTELLAEGSPLLGALHSPNRRVQFAAASTILQLDPPESFPGARRVVQIFARALNADTVSQAVVIDPNIDRGSQVAGALTAVGFNPSQARTGQEGFERAVQEGDVELVAVHLNTIRWELTQLLANFRTDPTTKQLPIVVYGPRELQEETERKLAPYDLVEYVPEAEDVGQLRDELTPLMSRLTTPPLTEQQRAAETAAAAAWLRHIAVGQRTRQFPLGEAEAALNAAINIPSVANDALVALGTIGRPSVQERLAEVGLAIGYGADVRETALVQLAFHIQRYGRMLDNATVSQIEQSYRMTEEPLLKSALAAVIGVLGPQPDAFRNELREHAAATAPLPVSATP